MTLTKHQAILSIARSKVFCPMFHTNGWSNWSMSQPTGLHTVYAGTKCVLLSLPKDGKAMFQVKGTTIKFYEDLEYMREPEETDAPLPPSPVTIATA